MAMFFQDKYCPKKLGPFVYPVNVYRYMHGLNLDILSIFLWNIRKKVVIFVSNYTNTLKFPNMEPENTPVRKGETSRFHHFRNNRSHPLIMQFPHNSAYNDRLGGHLVSRTLKNSEPCRAQRSLQDTSELHFFILFVLDIVRVNRWLFWWNCLVVALWQDVCFSRWKKESVQQKRTCFTYPENMMFQPFDSLFNHLFESIRVTDPLLYQTGQQIKPWTLPTKKSPYLGVWCWVSSKLLEKSPELGTRCLIDPMTFGLFLLKGNLYPDAPNIYLHFRLNVVGKYSNPYMEHLE